jgi:hypothetical protein
VRPLSTPSSAAEALGLLRAALNLAEARVPMGGSCPLASAKANYVQAAWTCSAAPWGLGTQSCSGKGRGGGGVHPAQQTRLPGPASLMAFCTIQLYLGKPL